MNIDPLLMNGNLWKIVLHNYQTEARIGAYEQEREGPQRLRLNAAVYVREQPAGNLKLEDVYNYDLVVEAIESVIQSGHIDLQETLIERIAAELMKNPLVRAVNIRSEKTEAYPKAEFIGVEAFFSKEQ